ncbi:hypothetical protein AALO_G00257080 [Alosa alosa]|uniref:Uncharacterized protein n=1 Tax=Alosa alosa TaxID=278164 RepID=A0AAV6FTY8_9TELE|nr:hypothetical protein AALO_G00257080 [Alosa alosa]
MRTPRRNGEPFWILPIPLFFSPKSAAGCLDTQSLVHIKRQAGRVSAKAMFSPTHIPDPVQFTAPTQEKLYLIVAFDEGASGPVAREWFTGKHDGGMAWWPPYKDSYKILQSVLKRTSPNPSKGWKQYSCEVLHETNCFESVSRRWGLSCNTSDLNTDKEELPVVRQRKRPSRLRSPSPSPPSSPASCPSSDTQNAPHHRQRRRRRKRTTNLPKTSLPLPPPSPSPSLPLPPPPSPPTYGWKQHQSCDKQGAAFCSPPTFPSKEQVYVSEKKAGPPSHPLFNSSSPSHIIV